MPLNNAPLVVIEWVDSCGSSGWHSPDDFEDWDGPSLCISIGWVMKETETGIALAPHISNIDRRDERVDGLFMIPKVAITSKTELSIAP